MIFHATKKDIKVDLKLKSGLLPYKTNVVYLSALFSDSGIMQYDIIQHALNKDNSVSIKLANFVTNNFYAPITVKLKVLNSCIVAAIMYACETWGNSNLCKI